MFSYTNSKATLGREQLEQLDVSVKDRRIQSMISSRSMAASPNEVTSDKCAGKDVELHTETC